MLNNDPSKKTAKYKCMYSGKSRMEPCAGCPDAKGCMSRAMQYKENSVEEKAVVKIGADGVPVACAKGAPLDQCGYKGGKVCGKCGAMAVQMKEGMDEMEDEESDVPMPARRRRSPMMDSEMDSEMQDDGEMNVNVQIGDDDEDDEESVETAMGRKPVKKMEGVNADDDPEAYFDAVKRRKARAMRINSMGMKSDDLGENDYLCAIDRKVLTGNSTPCAGCVGGCAPEGDLPTILEIEGLVEDTFGGKVLQSGYSDLADMFLVDVERKDGRHFEVLLDGSTGEPLQWSLLRSEEIEAEQKSLEGDSATFISFDEAVDIACKSVDGTVIGVDVDTHGGFDAYAVAIDGVDGKSYDVFLSTSGSLIEVKEYSQAQRENMAESGSALPDGSYPIANVEDLKNAIQAYGRAKDKNAARSHIMKMARSMGREDLVPDSWSKKSEEDDFMVTLMEWELLSAEDDQS